MTRESGSLRLLLLRLLVVVVILRPLLTLSEVALSLSIVVPGSMGIFVLPHSIGICSDACIDIEDSLDQTDSRLSLEHPSIDMCHFEVVDLLGREVSSGYQLGRVFLICGVKEGCHHHFVFLDFEGKIVLDLLLKLSI